MKRVKVSWGDQGTPCDRRRFELKPGETTTIDLARKNGAPIAGKVSGIPDEIQIAHMPIQVAPAAIEGLSPSEINQRINEFPTLDFLVCDPDGSFKTSLIPPGDYLITAEAYEPDPNILTFSYIPSPSYTGTARVTVPPHGRIARVQIHMTPRPKTSPATRPSADPAKARKIEDVAQTLNEYFREKVAAIAATRPGFVVPDRDFITIIPHPTASHPATPATRPRADAETVPSGLVGTWLSEDPLDGDEEMAVFPDGWGRGWHEDLTTDVCSEIVICRSGFPRLH